MIGHVVTSIAIPFHFHCNSYGIGTRNTVQADEEVDTRLTRQPAHELQRFEPLFYHVDIGKQSVASPCIFIANECEIYFGHRPIHRIQLHE